MTTEMKRVGMIMAGILMAAGVAAQENFREILFVEREQYALDHHNTETLFQWGEINGEKFRGGAALRALDVTTGAVRTLLSTETGVIRDPELSFDGRKIIFSMRPDGMPGTTSTKSIRTGRGCGS